MCSKETVLNYQNLNFCNDLKKSIINASDVVFIELFIITLKTLKVNLTVEIYFVGFPLIDVSVKHHKLNNFKCLLERITYSYTILLQCFAIFIQP